MDQNCTGDVSRAAQHIRIQCLKTFMSGVSLFVGPTKNGYSGIRLLFLFFYQVILCADHCFDQSINRTRVFCALIFPKSTYYNLQIV